MSPYCIAILLHYYGTSTDAEDTPEIVRNPPIYRETMDWFLREGLLSERGIDGQGRLYRITDRGICYVEHLIAQPLPVWRMP